MRRWSGVVSGLGLAGSVLQIAVVASALVLAGCATRRNGEHTASYARGPDPRIASAQVPNAAKPVDGEPALEGDGLPPQLPPVHRDRPLPDDPREPWSRNYGSGPVRRAEATPAVAPRIPSRPIAWLVPAGAAVTPSMPRRPMRMTSADPH